MSSDQYGRYTSVDVVDPSSDLLEAGDVLWYAGNASSISMIRKVPGLAPHSSDQVEKLNGNYQERRLVQVGVSCKLKILDLR